MASYTCRINIYLPLNNDLTPDTDNVGHFDIQILKSSVSLMNKTYSNPHISYGGEGVTITNGSDFTLGSKCMRCYMPFTVTDDDITTLDNNWLKRYCATSSTNTYDVTSGDFKTYRKERYNCFGAAAQWCHLMGYSTLKSIYDRYTNDGDGYKNYIPWAMFNTYHMAWTYAALRT